VEGSGTAVASMLIPVWLNAVLATQLLPPLTDLAPLRNWKLDPFWAEGDLKVSE
jgi:hypothetical protein